MSQKIDDVPKACSKNILRMEKALKKDLIIMPILGRLYFLHEVTKELINTALANERIELYNITEEIYLKTREILRN